MDSLSKLTDTCSTKRKMTIMHYLCKSLADKNPDLLDFHKTLVSLEASTKIQLKALADELQSITKGLEKEKQELAASADDGTVSELFHKMLKEFVGISEIEVANVMKRKKVVKHWFYISVKILNESRLSKTACEENIEMAEQEKKKAEIEEEGESSKSRENKSQKIEKPN